MNRTLLVTTSTLAVVVVVTARIGALRRHRIDEVWQVGTAGIDQRPR